MSTNAHAKLAEKICVILRKFSDPDDDSWTYPLVALGENAESMFFGDDIRSPLIEAGVANRLELPTFRPWKAHSDIEITTATWHDGAAAMVHLLWLMLFPKPPDIKPRTGEGIVEWVVSHKKAIQTGAARIDKKLDYAVMLKVAAMVEREQACLSHGNPSGEPLDDLMNGATPMQQKMIDCLLARPSGMRKAEFIAKIWPNENPQEERVKKAVARLNDHFTEGGRPESVAWKGDRIILTRD